MKRITLVIFVFVVGAILCLKTLKKSQALNQSNDSIENIKADSAFEQSYQEQSSFNVKP